MNSPIRNVRIARRRFNGTPEVLGEFYVPPFPLDHIKQELAYAQAQEPEAGWRLETRGFDRDWHEWRLS